MRSCPCRIVWGVLFVAVLAGIVGTPRAGGAMLDGQRGDGVADLCVGGRDLIVRADGAAVNGFILTSYSGLLAGEAYAGGSGVFVSDGDGLVADQFGYVLTGLHDLGRLLAGETALAALAQDLTLSYTVQGEAGVFYGTIVQASPGDADLDGAAGYWDLIRLTSAFGAAGQAVWVDGDFSGDAVVDAVDFITLKRNFGAVGMYAAPIGGSGSGSGAAPEPGALMIMASVAAWGLARPTRRGNHARTKEKAWATYERSEK